MINTIAPSILSADFGILAEEVESVIEAGCDWVHIDVMDGAFVPNLTFGPQVVKALRQRFDCKLDVHLMVDRPERVIPLFVDAGADVITIHQEATPHVHRALEMIQSSDVQAGLALNPATGIDCLPYVANLIDLLLVMTVNPGFGGQQLIQATLHKIRAARAALDDLNRHQVSIEVDGGINETTITSVKDAGANIFVAGSAIFNKSNRVEAVQLLRESLL